MILARLLIVVVCFWSMTISAQERQSEYEQRDVQKRELNRKEWKKIKNKIDYSKAKPAGRDGASKEGSGSGSGQWRVETRDESSSPEEDESSSGGANNLTTFLAILALAVVIAFLIYKFAMNTDISRNAKIADLQGEDEDRSPQDIPKSELELSLEKALGEENYREAIRIYFIFIIKELSEKGLIRWEKEKTNMAYQNELLGHAQHGRFSEVTYFFEYVWYGEHNIDRKQYESLEPSFKKLLNQLEGSE